MGNLSNGINLVKQELGQHYHQHIPSSYLGKMKDKVIRVLSGKPTTSDRFVELLKNGVAGSRKIITSGLAKYNHPEEIEKLVLTNRSKAEELLKLATSISNLSTAGDLKLNSIVVTAQGVRKKYDKVLATLNQRFAYVRKQLVEIEEKWSGVKEFTLENQSGIIKDLVQFSRSKGEIDEKKVLALLSLVDQTVKSKDVRNKIKSILNKLRYEADLIRKTATLPQFKKFDKKQLWRLFIDGKLQEKRGEYGFENELGYLKGLMKGFSRVLSTLGKKNTSASYQELHDLAIEDVFSMRGSPFRTGYRDETKVVGVPGDEIEMLDSVEFDLFLNNNYTKKGLKELQGKVDQEKKVIKEKLGREPTEEELQDKKWIYLSHLEEEKYRIFSPGIRTKRIHKRVNEIFAQYELAMSKAKSRDDKLTAMAACCQNLDQHHVFADGNIRTVVFLLLNKMLLENGFYPVIMDEPNVFDGFSVDELVSEIKKGQKNFTKYCN